VQLHCRTAIASLWRPCRAGRAGSLCRGSSGTDTSRAAATGTADTPAQNPQLPMDSKAVPLTVRQNDGLRWCQSDFGAVVCLQDFLHICKQSARMVTFSAVQPPQWSDRDRPVTEIFREPRIQNLATDPCLSCKSAHQRFKKSEPDHVRNHAP